MTSGIRERAPTPFDVFEGLVHAGPDLRIAQVRARGEWIGRLAAGQGGAGLRARGAAQRADVLRERTEPPRTAAPRASGRARLPGTYGARPRGPRTRGPHLPHTAHGARGRLCFPALPRVGAPGRRGPGTPRRGRGGAGRAGARAFSLAPDDGQRARGGGGPRAPAARPASPLLFAPCARSARGRTERVLQAFERAPVPAGARRHQQRTDARSDPVDVWRADASPRRSHGPFALPDAALPRALRARGEGGSGRPPPRGGDRGNGAQRAPLRRARADWLPSAALGPDARRRLQRRCLRCDRRRAGRRVPAPPRARTATSRPSRIARRARGEPEPRAPPRVRAGYPGAAPAAGDRRSRGGHPAPQQACGPPSRTR